MKLVLIFTLLVALVAAINIEPDAEHPRRRPVVKTTRPSKAQANHGPMVAARRPAHAPSAYKVETDKPTVKRDKSGLMPVPQDLADADPTKKLRRRTWRDLFRRQNDPDFYQCYQPDETLVTSDCDVVTDQVYNTSQTLVVSADACLVFEYQSCKGYFCALCDDTQTTTDFIANQLNTAEALCADNGQDGAVVSQDDPQWDSGFVAADEGLPTYDVCSSSSS